MSYTKKVAFNTIAQMLGKVASTALSIVTIAMLFRHLGIDGVGKYTTVFAFVGFFSVFADFGLQWTLIRELTVQSDKKKVLSNIFSFRLVIAVLAHLLAFLTVLFFPYANDVKVGVGIITLAWFFITMNTVLVGVFLNNYRLDISVTAEFVGRIFVLLWVYFATRIDGSFSFVMIAYLLGNIVNFILNIIFVRRYVVISFGFDFGYWKKIFSQALPIGLVMFFGFIFFKIDSLMLSLMKGMTDVGIYGTAYKLLEVLGTIPTMFLGAAFPLLTKYVDTNDPRLQSAFQKQFDFLSILVAPIVCGTFVLASPIINFISGSRGGEFIGASTVNFLGAPATSVTCLRILIFVVGFNFFTNLYNYMVISLGKQRSLILPTIGFALLNVIINLILIPRMSYVGAALATVITEIVVVLVYGKVVNGIVKLPVSAGILLKSFIGAIIMASIIWYFESIGINLFVNILIAITVYISSALIFKTFSIKEIRGVFAKS